MGGSRKNFGGRGGASLRWCKLTHLKHFTLNAAKDFIKVSQILAESTETWKGKSHFGRGIAPPCPP